MPVLTEDKVSGGIGVPPRWNPPPNGGGGDDGSDSSFPLSSQQIAIWLLMTGVAMLFAGLTSAYIVLRGVPSWESIKLPQLVWGNTLVLMVSSLTMELARRAVKSARISSLRQWLGITGILGLAFVVGQIVLWRQMTVSGVLLTSTLHSSFFYVLSGIHAVHILGGLVGLAMVTVKAWTGRLSSTSFEPLRLCATYWHFMGGVWLYLLLLLVLA
jgi:cytochrome c oxidase subunit III